MYDQRQITHQIRANPVKKQIITLLVSDPSKQLDMQNKVQLIVEVSICLFSQHHKQK